MSRRTRLKLLGGGGVIALALGYLMYAGITQSAVYFVTPSELTAAPTPGKAYRLGGLVERGSLRWEPDTVRLTFALTDGRTTVPVRHTGTPPDLFGEGRGAVVEGRWNPAGYFEATLIMAKHSEEYQAPHPTGGDPGRPAVRTLQDVTR
ncbi:MAG TPA: cytochrome c maturation protein CcmE [Candidatus Tectomicrobia bacterium]|nr:cytochrome c maturation protein CcmE [Candidatus Tectomicrobia bacterium]